MKNIFFTSLILGTLLLCFVSFLLDLPFSINWNMTYILRLFLSNFLIVLILGLLIKNSNSSGWKLALLIFSIFFIIGNFNILIEAYIFNVTDQNQTIIIIAKGLILALISSPIMVYLFGKWQQQDSNSKLSFKPRSALQWTWRIVLANLLYLFFYLLAGFVLYTVYPKLMDFYGDKVPPFSLMINTQFFRAFLFIGIAFLINRTIQASLFYQALLIGAVFSIFGGIAPLIMPGDELMPGYIRLGHAFEVGISNFLYGIILTYLIGRKTMDSTQIKEIQKNQLSNAT